MLAASLFLFGCGTNYWAGNSSGGEVEIDGVKIAAGSCKEIKVRGDFEWKVGEVAQTTEGDWLWNGADWSKLTDDQIKSCEENGKLEGAAGEPADPPADPNAPGQGAPAGVETKTAVLTRYEFSSAKEECKPPNTTVFVSEDAKSACNDVDSCNLARNEWKNAQETAGYTCQENTENNLQGTPCNISEKITYTCTKQQGS